MAETEIEFNPNVDQNVIVLDEHDTIDQCASAYGDRLAEWYEAHKLIVLPYWKLNTDISFLQTLTLPDRMHKIGSANGIDGPMFELKGSSLVSRNPLYHLKLDLPIKVLIRDQISAIFQQLRSDLRKLFPRYRMEEANITFRFSPVTAAPDSGRHVDVFGQSWPKHRLKLFLNMDTAPRIWRTSFDILRLLEIYREELRDISPNIDRNDFNVIVNERLGRVVPSHTIRYPTLSCIIGNGETVLHEVVSGNRMIAMEFAVDIDSMLNPDSYIGAVLPTHIRKFSMAGEVAS